MLPKTAWKPKRRWMRRKSTACVCALSPKWSVMSGIRLLPAVWWIPVSSGKSGARLPRLFHLSDKGYGCCHYSGKVLPAYWQGFATIVARLCQQSGNKSRTWMPDNRKVYRAHRVTDTGLNEPWLWNIRRDGYENKNISYLSSKKKNPPLLYSYVTYLYLINYTYSP